MSASRWSLCAVFLAFVFPGCTGEVDPSSEPDAVGVTVEPIVGGVLATVYPEAAILNIDVPAAGGTYWACSATIISPRVALTAGHCVDGHTRWDVYNGTQHQVSTSAATYDWHGNSTTVNPAQHDIGLVFLSADMVLASYPTLAAAPAAAGATLVNVGRIQNGTFTNNLYEASGPVKPGASYGYPYDYAATDLIQPGDSGGPDFLQGTHQIVAVNSGAGGGLEVLARTDLLASWIQQQIAAHPGSAAAVAVDAGGDHQAGDAAVAADAGGDHQVGDAAADVVTDVVAEAKADVAPPAATKVVDAAPDQKAPEAGTIAPPSQETEPNSTLAPANPIAGVSMKGAINPASDVDWFVLTAPVGSTVLGLSASADAVFSVGRVTGASCPFAVSGATSVKVTATGAPVSLCVVVHSPASKTQTYTLGVAGP